MTLPLSHNFATLPIGGGNDMSTKGGIYSDQKCPVCGGMFRDFGKALIKDYLEREKRRCQKK
jgi:hypothetical protein